MADHPSIFNTLGLNTENSLGLAKSDGAREILYLIDGLGLLALEKYRNFAPNLSAMNSSHQMQTAFPATTATSISSIGLGSLPGEHGMLGYTVRIPYSDNRLLNALNGMLELMHALGNQPQHSLNVQCKPV